MSKMEDIPVESEPAGATAQESHLKIRHHGANGTSGGASIGPIYNPAPSAIPRLINDVEQGMSMEVDDEESEIPDQVPELQWSRDDHDGRSVHSSMPYHFRSSRAFDAVTM
jgi:hypothetical protein